MPHLSRLTAITSGSKVDTIPEDKKMMKLIMMPL